MTNTMRLTSPPMSAAEHSIRRNEIAACIDRIRAAVAATPGDEIGALAMCSGASEARGAPIMDPRDCPHGVQYTKRLHLCCHCMEAR